MITNIERSKIEAIIKRIVQLFLERKNVIKFSGRKIEFWVLKDFGGSLIELYLTKSAVMV